jgi:hypothetical protein
MPYCARHTNFEVQSGVFFRAADPKQDKDWIPKDPTTAAKYYAVACSGNLEQMANVFGEAQMVHSGESSKNSPFISVAKCPLCLAESPDPTVKAIIANRKFFCQVTFKRKNEKDWPYVFEMSGSGIGAKETECLVLLPAGKRLSDYIDGYLTPTYLGTLQSGGKRDEQKDYKMS